MSSVRLLAALLLVPALAAAAPAAQDAVCPAIPPDEEMDERYPTYKYRCFAPGSYVRDGRSLGFLDAPPIDWVRPGINVGPCSTSFMLTDDEGRYYLTQSAHCVGSPGTDFCQGTYLADGAPIPIEGHGFGIVRYVSGTHMQAQGATDDECGSYDFAIVEIPASMHDRMHPAIRHVGGPTGLQDPLLLRYRDPMAGYGNSDDRGFAVEFLMGDDHGEQPVWPTANTFQGYYVGLVLNEAFCSDPTRLVCTDPYDGLHGYRQYVRYATPKITGDSGSADLTGDGKAVGVTSVVNLVTGLTGTVPLYDALLKVHHETGKQYYVVTWDEWSPTTIET